MLLTSLAKIKNNFATYPKLLALWMLIAASFSINLPIAFGSFSLGLFLLFWAISGDYKNKLAAILGNPGALVALMFFCLYGIGITYSSASLQDSVHYFLKHAKLLVIPLSIAIVTTDRYRDYVINAFLISLIGYLMVSYLNFMGFLDLGVMRHGTYLAPGAYIMLYNARRKSGQLRVVWAVLAVLTIFNILFVADVRTGIVTVFALLFMFLIETFGFRKGSAYWLVAVFLTFLVFKNLPSNTPNLRVLHVQEEVKTNISSAGERIEMYRHTLMLIKRHPFFGGGTGSIEGEYANLIKDETSVYIRKVTNPHNQYIMTAQDLGLFGLFILVFFWVIHWKQSHHLKDSRYGSLLRAFIVSIALGSVFNSLLLDSGDGRMYCIFAGVLLSAYKSQPANPSAFIKRFLDLVLVFVGIIIFFIPILLIWLVVVLTSPGPAIYWSKRVGRNNSIFIMPKFRSMRIDAPEVASHLLSNPEDYMTPIGSFLRRTSLDELPQLWSIFVGDMSFVGPRPALFNQDDLIELRTGVGVDNLLPGLTGWAQVNGRDDLPISEKVKMDVEYLMKKSLWLDIKILWLTILKVVSRDGVTH